MAVPAYTEDLTDISLAESTADGGTWSQIGGGGNIAMGAGPDFSMQGTNCVDAKVSNTDRGMAVPFTAFTPGADEHIFVWLFTSTPGLSSPLSAAGVCAVIGTGTTAYVRFHVDGGDTFGARGRVGKCYPIRYRTDATASPPYRTVTGTPGASPSLVGGQWNISGTVKGSNVAVDAIRRGTGAYLTAGELLSAGDGTDNPCTFTGFAAADNAVSTRWGILLDLGGGSFELQGRFAIGQNNAQAATLARFRASNQTIFFVDTPHALSTFTQVIVDHASTRCEWTNISFVALGTTNPGRVVVNSANPVLVWSGGSNANIGITTLRSNCVLSDVSWRGCGQVTANGATMLRSSLSGYEGATGTSALVWDTNDDTDGKLDDSAFAKGTAATHAIELGTTSPTSVTLRGMDFSGYNAANGQNDSTIHVRRTTGTVTINLVGCSGNISYISDGAAVTLVSNPVTLTVTAIDSVTGSTVQGARVLVLAGTNFNGGSSVTISRSGATATVAHTSHGLSTGNLIRIRGADQAEYNGVFAITVTGTDEYTYTVPGTPATPATGTIVSALVIIDATTNSSGQVGDTRSWGSNQAFIGQVRRGTISPTYKPQPVSGTIDSAAGASATAPMVRDG